MNWLVAIPGITETADRAQRWRWETPPARRGKMMKKVRPTPLAMTSGSRVEKWRKRQWYQMEKIWLGNRRRHVAEGTINDSVAQTQSRRE